jgi:hypothetical protein
MLETKYAWVKPQLQTIDVSHTAATCQLENPNKNESTSSDGIVTSLTCS